MNRSPLKEERKCFRFNEYFCEQCNIDERNPRLLPLILNWNIILNEDEIEKVLKSLDPSKAIGPDKFNPRILKEGASILKYPLCLLFNLSLNVSKFPLDWKSANFTLVFKSGSKNEVKNYRPISLISVLGKAMERCVFQHVHAYLNNHDIITSNQSGFTHGYSAINQLISISNEFGRVLDRGKEVRVIFCCISKAFDKVWHKGLVFMVKAIGINGKLLAWFISLVENHALLSRITALHGYP